MASQQWRFEFEGLKSWTAESWDLRALSWDVRLCLFAFKHKLVCRCHKQQQKPKQKHTRKPAHTQRYRQAHTNACLLRGIARERVSQLAAVCARASKQLFWLATVPTRERNASAISLDSSARCVREWDAVRILIALRGCCCRLRPPPTGSNSSCSRRSQFNTFQSLRFPFYSDAGNIFMAACDRKASHISHFLLQLFVNMFATFFFFC